MADIFELLKRIAKPAAPQGPVAFIVAGLGNPGKKYEKTRHNSGFMALDFVAERYGGKLGSAKFDALTGEAVIAGKRVLLVKPQTFMNNSGVSVAKAARFYKIPPENIIALADDVYLDIGRLRVRREGSAGGQKGIESIGEHLDSDAFPRIKIGVGSKPHEDYDLGDWVLSEFSEQDRKKLASAFPSLCSGLEYIISGDIEKAMQICNAQVK